VTSLILVFPKIDVNKVMFTSVFGKTDVVLSYLIFFIAYGASTLISLLPFGLATVLSFTTLTRDVLLWRRHHFTRVLLQCRHHLNLHSAATPLSFRFLDTSWQRSRIWFCGMFPRDFLPKLALSEQRLCFVSENVLFEIDNGAKCY